jgi:hypothetical protein
MAENIKFKVDADTSSASKGAEKIASSFKKAEKSVDDTNKSLKEGGKSGSKFGSIIGGLKFGAGLAAGKGILDSVMGSLMENEKVANLFTKALSVISGTASALAEILTPAFEAIGNAISNPKKAWDDVVKAFKDGSAWIKENLIDQVLDGFITIVNDLSIGVLNLRKNWNDFTGDAEESASIQEEINGLLAENIEIAKKQAERQEEVGKAVGKVTKFFKDSVTTIKDSISASIENADALKSATNNIIIQTAKINEKIKALTEEQALNESIANNERLSFQARIDAITKNLELKRQEIEQQKLLIQNEINLLALQNQGNKQSAEKTAQITALGITMKGLDSTIKETEIAVSDTIRGIEDQSKDGLKAITDATTESNRAILEASAQTEILEKDKLKRQLEAIETSRLAYATAIDEQMSKEVEGSAKYNELLAEKIAKEGEFIAARITGEAEYNAAAKEYAEQQRLEAANNLEMKAQAVNMALNGVSSLLKEDSKMKSAIAIGQAIMDTYVGATKALALGAGTPMGYINAAAIIVAGIANVVKIKKEASKLASDIGGSPPSGGNIPSVGPSINIAKSNVDSNTQLNASINGDKMKPTKAYVVSTEVTTGTSLDRKISQSATIGK